MTFSEWFGEWYRAKRFAAGKALRERGFYAATAALEALDQEQDATRKLPGDR